jgi:uncharacterized metal-binding protein
MADGHTHTRVTVFHGVYLSLTLFIFGFHNVLALAAGFFYQIFCSPDTDVDNGNISLYYLRKYTGFLHVYWQTLWYPYAISMKHRGKSHAVYGTIVRLIFILSPAILLAPQFRDDNPNRLLFHCVIAQILAIPLQIAAGFFIAYFGFGAFCLFITGIFLADILHLLFDSIIPSTKG